MNIHSLIHIVEVVRNYGPLWSYSCFGFESMNGHLKKHCHGTRNVLPQLARKLSFQQSVLDEEYNAKEHNDGIRGRVKNTVLCTEFLQALHQSNFLIDLGSTFSVFQRYQSNGVVYKALKDSEQLRNSSACKYKAVGGSTAFGLIHCFCLCNKTPIAIIAVFGSVEDAFKNIPRSGIPELNSFLLTKSCIYKVKKMVTKRFEAIPISSILLKCVHIHIDSKPYDFIIPMPNHYEHH